MSDEVGPLALVVGGGSGIGAALALAHRAAGAATVVWDVAGEHDVTCDVADPGAIDAAVDETRARWGVPTRVTVTAGVGHAGMLTDVPPEEFDRVLRVNARGPWLCMRAWARVLRAEGRPGSFVATSSISARLVDRSMGVYCASKAALSMLVRVAAEEWGPDGLRVNAVGPGVTKTPMLSGGLPSTGSNPWLDGVARRTSLGRLGEADDIAQTILAVHAMEWVTGQVIECDGGLSLRSPIDAYGAATRRTPASAPPGAGQTRSP
jgi:NAD(P)-dependent dehydrogenase (short-subunit alcohol dehydrogenase family)